MQEAEDGPAQQGKPAEEPAEPDTELAPGVSNDGVLLATELREAAPEGDTLVLDDLDDLDGLDDDLETPPLPPPPELPQAVAALQVLVAPVVFAAFQIETPRNPSGTLCACLSAGAAACTDLSFV